MAKDSKRVLEDNQLVCILTEKVKKISDKENNLQSTIRMLNEEYDFDLSDMKRDVNIEYIDPDTGRNKKQKVNLVIYENRKEKIQKNIIRVAIVQGSKVKETDKKKGVLPTLENAMGALENCEFGLWTNGNDIKYLQKEVDDLGMYDEFVDLSDIPGFNETLEDIDRN